MLVLHLIKKKPPHLKTLPQNLADVKYWRDTLLARFPILKRPTH